MIAPVVLVEAQPRVVATGALTTVRLAGGGAKAAYRYFGQDWWPGVAQLPTIVSRLGFDAAGWGAGSVPDSLTIDWRPTTRAKHAALAAMLWHRAPVTIRIGPDGGADGAFASALTGLVTSVSLVGGQMTITITDLAADMAKSVVELRFAGTGGVEGGTQLKEQPKRRYWGACLNIECLLFDKANNLWVIGDPARSLQAIDQVKDKGSAAGALTVVAWAGSVAATITALAATVLANGNAAVAPSISMLKWWHPNPSIVTADIRGETAGGYVDTAAGIAQRVLATRTGLAFDATTLATLAASRTDVCGHACADPGETVGQSLDRLLGGVGHYWRMNSAAAVEVGPWEWGAPVDAVVVEDAERTAVYAPHKTRRLGYQRNNYKHSSGEVAEALFAAQIGFYDGTTLQSVQPAEAGANVTETRTSADTAKVAGVPSSQVVGRITLGEDQQAQASRDLAEANLALIAAVLDNDRLRGMVRDAGISIDPETGKARLWALSVALDKIVKVSVDLDGVKGTLALKASETTVDNKIADAIAAATLAGANYDAYAGLSVRMGSAELTLAGHNAAISEKASLAALDGLTGTVTTIRTDLDAVTGELDSKVSTETFDDLVLQFNEAQSTLSTLGDVSSLVNAVSASRAARRDSVDGNLALLDAELQTDALAKAQRQALASAREELTARLLSGDGALAERIVNLAVANASAFAEIDRVDKASISRTSAEATSRALISARLDSLPGYSAAIEEIVSVIVDQIMGIMATKTTMIDIDGNLVGTQLVGSGSGPGSLGLINADLKMGTGRIIYLNDDYMMVEGIGFGSANQFLSWYGPTQAAIADCTEANALEYKKTNGELKTRATIAGAISPDATVGTGMTFADVLTAAARADALREYHNTLHPGESIP